MCEAVYREFVLIIHVGFPEYTYEVNHQVNDE
jgi:hypothetical protein